MKKLYLVRTIILTGSLLLQLGALCFQSRGAAGDVDLSFDPGSGVNGAVNAVVVQPDGKVIIGGGFTTVKGLVRHGIARLNADGSGDGTFNPGAGPHGISSLVLQPDGKVLVGHSTWLNAGSIPNWGILRLNSDGSLDTNFSASIESFYEDAGVYSMAVQSDGKVLIGGDFSVVNGTSRSGIARLNANGSLDSSFHPDAVLCCANSLALQPDGKVLVIGGFTVNGANLITIARLNANGSLDNTFDADGELSSALKMGLQLDGKILVAGYFTPPIGYRIPRLNSDGSLDGGFHPSLPPYEGSPYVGSLVAQSDGKILVTGDFTSVNGTKRSGIARLNADGSLDSIFNPSPGASGLASVALQPDGMIILGGNGIVRLNADGSLDVGFNSGKEISGDVPPQVSSVVVQPDGKVLLGGWFNSVQGTNRNRITRLNANGSLDSTFDPGTGANSSVNSVALQADGKVLIGGLFSTFNDTNCSNVARLNANGSLDYSFQPDLAVPNPGYECPPGYPCYDYTEIKAILVQPDGKVLIGGSFVTIVWPVYEGEDVQYIYRPCLGRFNADGSRESSFGTNTAVGSSVNSLAFQPDGKVLVGGSLYLNGTNYMITRLNADGSLDSSFNSVPGYNGVSSIALQSDGRVIIGGGFSTVHGASRNQVARLQANGNLDSSFNPGIEPNQHVYSVAPQPDGKVLIGGSFYYLNGTNYIYGIARCNPDGSLDVGFNPGSGASGAVRSIALQSDGNVLIGGDFTLVNGMARPRVARLYGDSAAPSLSITRSAGSVIVSWPVTGLNFQLQETTNLSLPNSWSPVGQSASTNAGHISVTVPASVGSKVFRLRSP
jgi:uncharacterized delta-60 repeat protein